MGLFLLLLSYVILVGRSVVLVYHGYRHDFMSSELPSSSSGGGGGIDEVPPSFDGEGGVVTVGIGKRWTSLASFLHELGVMLNASFEEGFGVWGGKHSEIGKLVGGCGVV